MEQKKKKTIFLTVHKSHRTRQLSLGADQDRPSIGMDKKTVSKVCLSHWPIKNKIDFFFLMEI